MNVKQQQTKKGKTDIKMKKLVTITIAVMIATFAHGGQVVQSNVDIDHAVQCPDNTPTIVTQVTLSAGTWTVHGVENMEFTNANPGHNLGVAFVADVTTRNFIRHDGFSSLPGTVFSSHYGYMTGSPQRVITVTQPTVVNLLAHVIVGTGNARAWGSIIATKE